MSKMRKSNPSVQTSKLGNKIKKEKGKGKETGKENKPDKSEKKSGEEPVGHKEAIRFFLGLALLVLSLFMMLSFASFLFTGDEDMTLLENGDYEGFLNYAGALGARCADFFINRLFGLSSFFIPIFVGMAAMKLTRAYKVRLWKWFLNCSILTFWCSAMSAFFLKDLFENLPDWNFINPGGEHGTYVTEWLNQKTGVIGTFLILLLTALCYLIYLSNETILLIRKLLNPVDYIKSKFPSKDKDQEQPEADKATTEEAPAPQEEGEETAHTIDFDVNPGPTDTHTGHPDDEPAATELTIQESTDSDSLADGCPEADTVSADATTAQEQLQLDVVQAVEEEVADEEGSGALEPYDPKLDLENYKYPTLELLDKRNNDEAPIDMEEQNKNKDQIIEVLKNFGVGISSIKATIGPTITLYEITPAQGVRISKIKNLEDDIALSLRALGIRIIAPIPGKGTIGIEVPNARPRIVSMESILNSRKFRESEFELPIALGKTITNEVFMVDLAKMPHLLVAGATGQGKSVGLNAIITSLLYKKHPAELKFVMVDPKKVEFSIYSPIENHFLAKIADGDDEAIITDVQKVVATLKSLCCEMDTRYDLLKKARARNIKEYNTKFKNRQLNPDNGHKFMPYIEVVIDEFGDLIMTAGKEIELPIARIAQLARAVGIHMIIATQRPTTNIITGTIKANFPARMAFKVSAMIDSRTILDRPGANQLIGRGDMLFLSGSEPVRVQCAFVDTPEVERITAYIAKQQSYLGPLELPKVEMEGDEDMGGGNVDMTHLDPLFEEAARLIISTQQGSTSMIQRKFAIGYNRAGRLMDQLEKAGIVGAAQGSKPREVLCMDDQSLMNILNGLR